MARFGLSIVVFVLGVAGGFLIGQWRADDGETLVTGAPGDQTSDGAGERPEGPRRSTTPINLTAPGATNAAISKTSLDALVKELAPADVERGDGAITGTVRAENGAPIAGAIITATPPVPAWVGRAPKKATSGEPDEPSVQEVIEEAVRQHLWRRTSRVDARSKPDGSFVLEGLRREARYELRAYAAGAILSTAEGEPRPSATAGQVVDFVAKTVVSLAVSVCFEDGTEPPFAWISARAGDGGYIERQRWTPEARVVDLRDGVNILSAAIDEEEDVSSDEVAVTLPLASAAEPPKIQIRRRIELKGRIVPAVGERLANVYVAGMPVKDGRSPTDENLRNSNTGVWVYGNNCAFNFGEVAKGSWVIGVFRDSELLAKTLADVGAETKEVEIRLPAAKAADFVVVKLQDPEGRLIHDGWVHELGGDVSTIRRTDGTFWVARRRKISKDGGLEDVVPALATLMGSAPQWGQKTKEYSPASDSEVAIRFDPTGTLTVNLDGYKGSAVEGHAEIRLGRYNRHTNADGNDNNYYQNSGQNTTTQAQREKGEFHLIGIQPGAYFLHLTVSDSRNSGSTIARQKVQIVAGANAATIVVPELYTVTVETSGLKAGQSLNLNRIDGSDEDDSAGYFWLEARIDEQGRGVFEGLPPGEYALNTWLNDAEAGALNIAVTGDATVKYSADPADSLLVVDVKSDGVGALGIKDGDVIYGAAGIEWQSNPSQAIQGVASAGGTVALKVMRGGAPIEVSVDSKAFLKKFWKAKWRSIKR